MTITLLKVIKSSTKTLIKSWLASRQHFSLWPSTIGQSSRSGRHQLNPGSLSGPETCLLVTSGDLFGLMHCLLLAILN